MTPPATPDRPEVPPGETAASVAAAVLAVPGVAALHAGSFGEIATYLPGRRITGVRLRDTTVEVHVTLLWGAPVLSTADAIRVAVSAITPCVVDLTVQDVVSVPPRRTS